MSERKKNDHFELYSVEHTRKFAGHFLVGKLIAAFFGVITNVLTARWLIPEEYAVYVLLSGMVLLLGVVSSFGLREVVQRFLPELVVSKSTTSFQNTLLYVFSIRILVMLLFGCAIYLMAPLCATLFSMEYAAWSFEILAFVFITGTLFTFSCLVLETLMRQMIVKWILISMAIIKLSLIVLLKVIDAKLTLLDLLVIDILAYGMSAVPAIIWVLKTAYKDGKSKSIQSSSIDSPLYSRIVKFALFNYIAILALTLQGGPVNKIMVGALLPVYVLALFGFAQTMSDILHAYMPNTLFLNIVRPAIIAHWSRTKDIRILMEGCNLFFKINLFLLMPLLAWLTLCGSSIAGLISGGKYEAAGPLLLALCSLLIFQFHNRRYELALQALEHTRPLIIGNLFVVVSVFLSVFLVQFIGVWGIVVASICGLLSRDLYLHFALIRYGISPAFELKWLVRQMMTFLIVILTLWPVSSKAENFIDVIIIGLLCLLLYLLFGKLLSSFSRKEKSIIEQLLGRRIFIL